MGLDRYLAAWSRLVQGVLVGADGQRPGAKAIDYIAVDAGDHGGNLMVPTNVSFERVRVPPPLKVRATGAATDHSGVATKLTRSLRELDGAIPICAAFWAVWQARLVARWFLTLASVYAEQGARLQNG